ncbi:hypothetical protein F0P96_00085 [Hymenobacter busanensis]|uniref:Uncharacterized protein n=1 Tax=Hymenobacter busanensis TaxID=2607656 RepID=A0A7L4ZUQ9_9BACT|nr:hypothetical protein [Hymenobacter busanensis]KAA9339073.1 hypothetical protein F0P96_00085 [Hymenobacter busanensis]QHJ07164.1 hypothetical protein GUY19_07660 [Hymenobacter busanensis]
MKPFPAAVFPSLLAGLACSCQSKPPIPGNHHDYFYSVAKPHAQLVLTPRKDSSGAFIFTYYNYAIKPGNKLVFALGYIEGDSTPTYHDEPSGYTAVFEVPDTATAFQIREQEFRRHNGLLTNFCPCITDVYANKALRLGAGSRVSGRKLGPFTWVIHSEIEPINFTDTIDIRKKNVLNALK